MSVIKVKVSSLRAADIIVSTTGANVSGVIRNATGADVSHAALFSKPHFVIEAIGEGVKERQIDQAYKEATLAIVLRRTHMTDNQRLSVVNHARKFAGLPYDAVGAAGSGATTKRGALLGAVGCMLSPVGCSIGAGEIVSNASPANRDKRFFCSELVARAFELAGVPIVDSLATNTNPRAIRTSSRLIYVGHLIGG